MRTTADANVGLSLSLIVSPASSGVAVAFSVKFNVVCDSVSTGSASVATVIVTAPLACLAPPEPVLPKSSIVMSMRAAPAPVAEKLSVPSAALRSASVPRSTTLVSFVPVPLTSVNPAVLPNDSVPLASALVLKVSCTLELPASTSETVIALAEAAPKVNGVGCGVACAPGRPSRGASLTATTLIAMLPLAVLAPPLPLLPRSLTLRSICAAPL